MIKFVSALVLLTLLSAASANNKAVLLYQRVEGANRVCVYDTPQGRMELTIPAGKSCPVELDIP